mmetsp:Transcript_97/g.299  ORF Transcript_97/g.299 Transcript_97/m.299 type:complete len:207 (+) Transcript_97:19-639(+)
MADFFSFCCSQRQEGPQGAASSGPVGVGIVFQPDSSSALFVKSLSLDGPAFRSGMIEIGDCLHEIDNLNVYRKPVSMVAPLMLGKAGSNVRLGFVRQGYPNIFYVELKRGASSVPPGSLSSRQYAHHLSTNLKSVPAEGQRFTSRSTVPAFPSHMREEIAQGPDTVPSRHSDHTPLASAARLSAQNVTIGTDFPSFPDRPYSDRGY